MFKTAQDQAYKAIRGAWVLRGADVQAAPSDILLKGDTIVELGVPGFKVPAGTQDIDAHGKLLHPGLINAHTHGYGSYTKGMGDRWNLEQLLTVGPWLNADRTLHDKSLSATLNAAEMLLKGCTACYDLYAEAPVPTTEGMLAVAHAYIAAGMRATIAPMTSDTSFYRAIPGLLEALPADLREKALSFAPQDYRVTLAQLEGFLTASFDQDRIKVGLAPTIPLLCSDGFLLACRDTSLELGISVHTHIAESKLQALVYQDRYGCSVVQHLHNLGMLSPDFVLAHGVWMDETDLDLIGAAGASVAHNPGCNMRLGSGIANVRAMLDHGINVGIGTDGSTSSDNQNMYEAQRLAALVSRVSDLPPERWIGSREAFYAATEGSAKSLGFGGTLGRLDPHYKADIVFLDMSHVNWIARNDVVNQLVYAEDGGAVEHVMVGGEFVVRDRQLVNVDLGLIQQHIQQAKERLLVSTAGHKELADSLSKTVGSFCSCLAQPPYPVDRWAAYR